MTAALPVSTAVRRAATLAATCVVAVSRRATCHHLYQVRERSDRLTRAGNVPRGRGPVCGQRGRRWRGVPECVASSELPLCGRCAAWVERNLSHVDASLDELVDALRTARRLVDVEQLVCLAAQARLSTALVFLPGERAAPLHRHVAAARNRIAPPVPDRRRQAFPMSTRHRLTACGRAALAFERLHWQRPGAKDAAVRDLFDLSPTRYVQQLNQLLDHPAALRAEPAVVHRLRRLRDERRTKRREPTIVRRVTGPLLPVRSASA